MEERGERLPLVSPISLIEHGPCGAIGIVREHASGTSSCLGVLSLGLEVGHAWGDVRQKGVAEVARDADVGVEDAVVMGIARHPQG